MKYLVNHKISHQCELTISISESSSWTKKDFTIGGYFSLNKASQRQSILTINASSLCPNI